MSTVPHYEDKHAATSGYGGYEVTNEEPIVHRELLRGQRFRLGGGIAGGGDIPIFVLAPRCKKVIVADHSYNSIAAFLMKAHILLTHSVQEIRGLLEDKPAFERACAALLTKLPEELHKSATLATNWVNLRREWHYFSDRSLSNARRNLSKIHIVHGDIQDLKAFGQFDLLYFSNAQDHTNGRLGQPKAPDVEALIKPGGYLLYTHNSYAGCQPPGQWQALTLKEQKGIYGYRTSWRHILAQKAA